MSQTFNVAVEVSLREGIADPEGLTIERALPALGFSGVSGVRVGKSLRFVVEAPDEDEARQQVESMCERFLANPVIEDVEIAISGAS
ncbi:MAG: phosphoribosylformylglycinamidine synthase subunit PurS [Acidimicrobiia bacterium]|nr:phosphoribosylformylglycinamidine synthase subunit PurS [Acidimicrobiia bacterium]MCY4433805.1 phosphoribosylformylglycinamidine synthase subunit PurS [bacterium]